MNPLTRHNPYAYLHPDNPEHIALWHVRVNYLDAAERIAEGKRGKDFYYRHPPPEAPHTTDWRLGYNGKPPAELADRCLFELTELRAAIAAVGRGGGAGAMHGAADPPSPSRPLFVWAEGEADAISALCLGCEFDVEATSHHGGADKATPEQAQEFAPLAGQCARRAGARVLVAADRDDAGAACALRRWELLREAGLHPDQLAVVRAADGVCGVTGSGRGADLSDHHAAGLGLADLVPLIGEWGGRSADGRAEGRVRSRAAVHRAYVARGGSYGAPEDGRPTPGERAEAAEDWKTRGAWLCQ